MIAEVVELVRAALADPTTGVNARLAVLPRVSGHAAPPTVTVSAETTALDPATRRSPGTAAAALAVEVAGIPASDDDAPHDAANRDATVEVVIRYETPQAQPHLAQREASYTLRAAMQCLRALNRLDPNTSAKLLNGVCLWYVTNMRLGAVQSSREDGRALWALAVTYTVRDTAAL